MRYRLSMFALIAFLFFRSALAQERTSTSRDEKGAVATAFALTVAVVTGDKDAAMSLYIGHDEAFKGETEAFKKCVEEFAAYQSEWRRLKQSTRVRFGEDVASVLDSEPTIRWHEGTLRLTEIAALGELRGGDSEWVAVDTGWHYLEFAKVTNTPKGWRVLSWFPAYVRRWDVTDRGFPEDRKWIRNRTNVAKQLTAEIDGGQITTPAQIVSRLYLANKRPAADRRSNEVVLQLGMSFPEAVKRLGRFGIEVGPDNRAVTSPPKGFSTFVAGSRKWQHGLVITKRDDSDAISSIEFCGDLHSDEGLPLLLRMEQDELVRTLTISDLQLGNEVQGAKDN